MLLVLTFKSQIVIFQKVKKKHRVNQIDDLVLIQNLGHDLNKKLCVRYLDDGRYLNT